MKYNLRNRPKGTEGQCGYDSFDYKQVKEWFEGFEKELRERLKIPFKDCITVKEVLGE